MTHSTTLKNLIDSVNLLLGKLILLADFNVHYDIITIINSILIRRKIFRRTQSAQLKNKKNAQKLWIKKPKKTWRKECFFKWALNSKKLAMLRRLLGSEFQTGWLQVNPGNFEEFFIRWSKNARWLISKQNRIQIRMKNALEMTESQNRQFVLRGTTACF